MNLIPNVIHQIWSGVDEPLPLKFQMLGNTWKELNPNWKYEFWDNDRMNAFVKTYYPIYWNTYQSLKYNIQRWDVIRYFILYHMGGVYVDFDYECLEPINSTLKDKTCCFSAEPREHCMNFQKEEYFNNAFIASIPQHPFLKLAIDTSLDKKKLTDFYPNKLMEVLNTTGPLMLTDLYNNYKQKNQVYIIPEEIISPLTKNDIYYYLHMSDNHLYDAYLESKIEKAVAIHYFVGEWLN